MECLPFLGFGHCVPCIIVFHTGADCQHKDEKKVKKERKHFTLFPRGSLLWHFLLSFIVFNSH